MWFWGVFTLPVTVARPNDSWVSGLAAAPFGEIEFP
jgi:hypothetical protein